jgi:redox-sensitive bicupin YhaK (pirin superfamily)
MEPRDLRDLVEFSPDGPLHHQVFESGRLWSELVCLDRAQQMGPVSDPGSDAVLTVVAGEVVVQVGRSRKRIGQWSTVLVDSGDDVTITNASSAPAVVMIVAAPPPTRRNLPS